MRVDRTLPLWGGRTATRWAAELLLGGLFAWSFAASAAPPAADQPPGVLAELVTRAQAGTLQTDWLQAQVPRLPHAGWASALQSGGPLAQVLATTDGVVHRASVAGQAAVVLEGPVPLYARVDANGRLRELRVTSCVTCPEHERFVRDLLEDVRRRGSLGHRLLPGLELSVAQHIADNPGLRDARWVSSLEAHLLENRQVGETLAGAHVMGAGRDWVGVGYADGQVDRWAVQWVSRGDQGGWQVTYSELAPNSPLRLSQSTARRWRRLSHRHAQWRGTWEPPQTPTADGAGVLIGEAAIGAGFGVADSTVWVVSYDLDHVHTGVFAIDEAGTVLARHGLPLGSHKTVKPIEPDGAWLNRFAAAPHPDGTLWAINQQKQTVLYTPANGEVRTLTAAYEPVALSWQHRTAQHRPAAAPDRVVVAEQRGSLRLLTLSADGDIQADKTLRGPEDPVAVHWVDDTLTVIARDGTQQSWSTLTYSAMGGRARRCSRGVVSAVMHPFDHSLAVRCAAPPPPWPTQVAGAGEQLHPTRLNAPMANESWADLARAPLAWSPDGRWIVDVGHDGVPTLRNAHTHEAVSELRRGPAVFGASAPAQVRGVSFSPRSQSVLGVWTDGTVWRWSVDTLIAHAAERAVAQRASDVTTP